MTKDGKKTGGRKKGVSAQAIPALACSVRKELGEEFDPVFAMADMGKREYDRVKAEDPEADKEFALSCFREVSQYVHAKRKAMEVSGGESGEPVRFEMVLSA